MPPRYAFRLEDLRAWHVVEAACGSCRHRAVIDHASLTPGRPSSMRLADLETKLETSNYGVLPRGTGILAAASRIGDRGWAPPRQRS